MWGLSLLPRGLRNNYYSRVCSVRQNCTTDWCFRRPGNRNCCCAIRGTIKTLWSAKKLGKQRANFNLRQRLQNVNFIFLWWCEKGWQARVQRNSWWNKIMAEFWHESLQQAIFILSVCYNGYGWEIFKQVTPQSEW